jgi:hypothetical protein
MKPIYVARKISMKERFGAAVVYIGIGVAIIAVVGVLYSVFG